MKLPRNAQIWLGPYLRQRISRPLVELSTEHPVSRVWLCMADHYEPFWNRVDFAVARQRVALWREKWPIIAASAPPDSAQSPPKYTFFYPEEEYHPELLNELAALTQMGLGDVEVHIHHDRDGRSAFIRKVQTFCRVLHEQHGLLRERSGVLRFGFIHGNWALDNSLPGGKWCGLNDEIQILRDLGCYADFTMPSGDSPSQARTLNSIYWCTDDPERPKSYDGGRPVTIGGGVEGDLMMITGPFGLRWRGRLTPRMEFAEIAVNDPASEYRVRRWFDLGPRIGSDLFLKLHSHGTQERNSAALLGGGLADLFRFLPAESRRRRCELRYVTAWEMYCAIEAIRLRLDPVHAVQEEREGAQGVRGKRHGVSND
jgi:hypothetical protein